MPAPDCSRQTNPGLPSASAFNSSIRAAKPAISSLSSGAFMRAMFTLRQMKGAAQAPSLADSPDAIAARVVTVFQLRVVASTPSARSKALLFSFVLP